MRATLNQIKKTRVQRYTRDPVRTLARGEARARVQTRTRSAILTRSRAKVEKENKNDDKYCGIEEIGFGSCAIEAAAAGAAAAAVVNAQEFNCAEGWT